jgi:hypothetical protein
MRFGERFVAEGEHVEGRIEPILAGAVDSAPSLENVSE